MERLVEALSSSPLEIAIALLVSVIAARKAADVMGTSRRSMALLFGTALALVGPLLASRLLVMLMPDAATAAASLFALVGPEVCEIGSRTGFALVGVLVWSSIEAGG